MDISDKIANPRFWGAFKIPAYAFAVIALLMVLRNVGSPIEYAYIQHTANYAIGASIISYCHSLTHSTWINHKWKPDLNKVLDLPMSLQVVFMLLHVIWFGVTLAHLYQCWK